MATEDALDADEFLHLALRATRRNEVDAAFKYVDKALAIAPGDPRLHHLRGGLLAERGDVEGAVQAMERALALDPRLWGAHFQLGLLHATSGRTEQATQAWAPLDVLPESHPLRLFKSGLERLEREEYEDCIACLTAGIAVNHESAALNSNMRRVIEKAEERLRTGGRVSR